MLVKKIHAYSSINMTGYQLININYSHPLSARLRRRRWLCAFQSKSTCWCHGELYLNSALLKHSPLLPLRQLLIDFNIVVAHFLLQRIHMLFRTCPFLCLRDELIQ